MKVSVIIPTYNNAGLVVETLKSIYSQTYRDIEIIVVDDGSTDNTASVLASHVPRITYVHQSNSGGCSKPRNVGYTRASGDVIAFFDSDDLMAPDKIERQVEFLIGNPKVDFVFTDFVNFDGHDFHDPHTSSCVRFRCVLDDYRLPSGDGIIPSRIAYGLLLHENFIGGSSIAFRRRLFEALGGYNEAFNVSEDRELFLRVARDHDMGFIDKIGHHRRIHAGAVTRDGERMLRAQIKLFEKERDAAPDGYVSIVEDQLISRYSALARHLREQRRFAESLTFYWRSICEQPAQVRIYLGVMRCIVAAFGSRLRG